MKIIVLVAVVPVLLSALAQMADEQRFLDTLLQVPYVVAFGWFVLKLADKQDKFIRDILDIVLKLCDENDTDKSK